MSRLLTIFVFSSCLAVGNDWLLAADEDEFFEKRIRPLLASRCWKCHLAKKQEGGLRLDSSTAVRNGGDSGPAIQPRDVERSLLITAVRQTTELKMPPKGKLSPKEVAALEQWVKSGAVWPVSEVAEDNTPTKPVRLGSAIQAPNDPALAAALQLWLKADALGADDGAPVHVWPDQSGRGHDLAATKGVRKGGTGTR